MSIKIKNRIRREKGREYSRYHEKLSFNLRDKLDLFDYKVYWNDWNSYNDDFRNYFYPYKNKGIFRKKYLYLYNSKFTDVDFEKIMKRLNKWTKKKLWVSQIAIPHK